MDRHYPMFMIPLEVTASRRLTAEEKLVYGSLHTWLYTDRPADFREIADRVALDEDGLRRVLRKLRGKGLVKFNWNGRRAYEVLRPDWLDEEIGHLACEPVTVEDPDGELAEGDGEDPGEVLQ